ncbi:MAG: acetyltransferase [Methanomicrobiales archaeon]|nr:acetyltransferase [Methanomicrobiales archaeon]NYT21807.1 acetyltransferase [Methanomicrobiales archaeon]
MNRDRCPVVLVHGWKSHPGIWNRFIPLLARESFSPWLFGYDTLDDPSLTDIAAGLRSFIGEMRDRAGYDGPLDFVCHCMGTVVARYLMEVMDGEIRREKVRLLIGLGPPNNGSSIAELFHDADHGPDTIDRLTGVFIPEGYDPLCDRIVREFRPGSGPMRRLRAAGLRSDLAYRLILTENRQAVPGFFPTFTGKTWQFCGEQGWELTCHGDGIVPHSDSVLPGAGLDILPLRPEGLGDCPSQYCHFNLPRNDEIMNRVLSYLYDPGSPPCSFCPDGGLSPLL